MSLRARELDQVVGELASGLTGATVQKLWVPSPQRLCLSLRQVGRTTWLWLCTDAGVARLSVVRERPAGGEDSSVQRVFRQELTSSQLVAVGMDGPKTVVLGFLRDGATRSVVAELGAGARLRIERIAVPTRRLEPEGPESRLQPAADSIFPFAAAAEALFEGSERAQDEAALRRRLRAPLQARLKRLDRTLGKVAAEADRKDAAESHRRQGELLRHHLGTLPRGERRVTLTEYTAEGPREVDVALDPSLAPRDQVERHFQQYRRMLRGTERAGERWVELRAERAPLEAALTRIDTLTLEALRDEMSQSQPSPAARAAEGRRSYREYLGAAGARIWVGRGGADNDALTFGLARPEHWWLHVRGVGGAHVVVPLSRDAELPPELLLDAAHLALHHSVLKGEMQGEVSYTRVKFVRKMKGGAPGQVTYTREKTFWLRVEPERLARLLSQSAEATG